MYSHVQSPLPKENVIFHTMCYVVFHILSSVQQVKRQMIFLGGTTLWCGWKPLHALVAAAQTGWAKRMWELWEFLREALLWSALGPLQEQKENHFCNKQIMSWLFFLEGSRLCWAARYAWLPRTSPSSLTLFRVATDKSTLKAPEQTTSSVTNSWLVCS